MSRNDSEAAGRDDADSGPPAGGSAGDAASDGGRSSDRSRSSDGGALLDRSPSAEGSANGAVPETETQTELETFWVCARNVAGTVPLEAVLGQDDATSLRPPASAFGDSPEMSDRLAKLVLDGEESATPAQLASYEAEGIDILEVGGFSVMRGDADRLLALLRTMDVRKIPSASAGPKITRTENGGTLGGWKTEHRDFSA